MTPKFPQRRLCGTVHFIAVVFEKEKLVLVVVVEKLVGWGQLIHR